MLIYLLLNICGCGGTGRRAGLRNQCQRRGGSSPFIRTNDVSVRTNRKQRLEFICELSKVTPTFINGSIRKIEKTNISYIEPHRVIIKNITFLVFNY